MRGVSFRGAANPGCRRPFRPPWLWPYVGHASACQPASEPAFPMPGQFLGLRTTTRDVHEAGETLPYGDLLLLGKAAASLARLDKLKHVLPRRPFCSMAPKWPNVWSHFSFSM